MYQKIQFKFFYLLALLISITSADNSDQLQGQPGGISPTQSTSGTHQDNVAQYVAGGAPYSPPTAYHYTEPNYGPVQPYDNYVVPYQTNTQPLVPEEDYGSNQLSQFHYFQSVMPYARMLYRLVVKAGVIVFGGALILAVGGLMTTLVCTYTPLCTIQFNGMGINRESMRSLMTADNLSAATAFVQDAIEKYHKINKKY